MKKPRKRRKRLNLRDGELAKTAKYYFDLLLELHDQTDPKLGKRSEANKLNLARHAFHIWWRLYGHIMLWAQAQITGYHVARDSPEWVDHLIESRGEDVYPDHHEIELLGLTYPFNPPSEAQGRVQDLADKIENVQGGLHDESLRRIIDEILLSVDANSSYWRFPLGHALRAANYGEAAEFFKPAKRARGQAYALAYHRALAIAHVHYFQGKGIKKYIALKQVADALNVSPETIRDWEKALKDDDYFAYKWSAAGLAGEIETIKDTMSPKKLRDTYTEWQFAARTNVDMALTFLEWSKDSWSLKTIKDEIRKAQKKSGA